MSLDYPNPTFTEEVHVDLGTGNVPAGTGELTITGWINPDQAGIGDSVIIAKSDSTGNDGAFKMQLEEPFLELRGIINDNEITGATQLPTGAYTFVAMVYDSSDKTLFINAVQDDTEAAAAGDIDINSDPLILGALDDGDIKRTLDGLLDDLRVYTRTLSLAELETMFTLRGADNIVDGLLWRWRMNELSPGNAATVAGSIIDLAGNLNGDPINSPVYAEGILR